MNKIRFMSLPNMITMFRVISAPIICIFIIYGLKFEAASLFLLSCFSDFLDGYVARMYSMTSKFGQHFDSFADKMLITLVLLTLLQKHIISGFHVIPVYVIIMRNLVIYFIRNYINEIKQKNIAVHTLGKITTCIQMCSMTLLIFDFSCIGNALLWIAMTLSVISLINYLFSAFCNKHYIID